MIGVCQKSSCGVRSCTERDKVLASSFALADISISSSGLWHFIIKLSQSHKMLCFVEIKEAGR